MSTKEATVKLLSAEVKTLQVGSRQVTLSVYRQLDNVKPEEIEPFGRVHDAKDCDHGRHAHVVGKDRSTGVLVRSGVNIMPLIVKVYEYSSTTKEEVTNKIIGSDHEEYLRSFLRVDMKDPRLRSYDTYEMHAAIEKSNRWKKENAANAQTWLAWIDLPLIILAGLR